MNYFNLLAWVCAPSSTDAMAIWQQCNPNKKPFNYTNDPDIKAFWKTHVGRLTLWGVRPRWEIEKIPHYYRLLKWKITKNHRKITELINTCFTIQKFINLPRPINVTIAKTSPRNPH